MNDKIYNHHQYLARIIRLEELDEEMLERPVSIYMGPLTSLCCNSRAQGLKIRGKCVECFICAYHVGDGEKSNWEAL